MTFLSPERLWLLLAVAALVVCYVLVQRRRSVYAVRFTNLALLDRVAPRGPGLRRHLPAAAFLVMMLALVVGFAQPQAEVKVPRERATVLLALDVSASMQAEDVDPTRIEAAQKAATRFVKSLPNTFNVSLITFSANASQVVAPTTDHDQVVSAIKNVQLGGGTAIGDAVGIGVDTVRQLAEDSKSGTVPARMVLLSDGANTTGTPVDEAAAAAKQVGMPVWTIAFGSPQGTITIRGLQIPVPADTDTLNSLAEATGGRFYTAESAGELRAVYSDIGSSIGYRTEQHDVSARFIGLGLLAAIAAAAGSLVWFSRLP